MKNLLYFIALVLLSLSCNDIGHSPLKGKWQLKTVERNGAVSAVDTLWYNFQSESLFALQIYMVQKDTFVLPVGFRREKGNLLEIEMITPAYLEYTDWTDVKRTFTVEKCREEKLTLKSEEGYIYNLIKF